MKTKTDTKRLLIDTTKAMLCEKGSFTVKEISDKAFTNVAAINYHFGDKNNLIRIAIGEMIDDFKQTILLTFDRQFDNNGQALESVVEFLLQFYSSFKGAIKFILMTDDEEGDSRFVERFFFDRQFNDVLMNRIATTTGETDRTKLFYKYSISISAFLFSLLLEGKHSSMDDKLSLSALQQEDNKKAFVETLMLLYR